MRRTRTWLDNSTKGIAIRRSVIVDTKSICAKIIKGGPVESIVDSRRRWSSHLSSAQACDARSWSGGRGAEGSGRAKRSVDETRVWHDQKQALRGVRRDMPSTRAAHARRSGPPYPALPTRTGQVRGPAHALTGESRDPPPLAAQGTPSLAGGELPDARCGAEAGSIICRPWTGLWVYAAVTAPPEPGMQPAAQRAPPSAPGTSTSKEAGRHSTHQATRRTPGTASKCMSRLSTGKPCCRARAAIHASLEGIGVPRWRNESRTAA